MDNNLYHSADSLTKLEHAKIELAKAIAPFIFSGPDWFNDKQIADLDEAVNKISIKLLHNPDKDVNLFKQIESGLENLFKYKGSSFIANNLHGHWEILLISDHAVQAAYYHGSINSMNTLYRIAEDLLHTTGNLRYDEKGEIDGEFPLDDDNPERNAMINLIQRMGDIIKKLDTKSQFPNLWNNEGYVPELSDIFNTISAPEQEA